MKTGAWSQIKSKIKDWDQAQLVDLIKDMHGLSADNKAFLTAKVGGGGDAEEVLEPYRQRVVEQFFPKRERG